MILTYAIANVVLITCIILFEASERKARPAIHPPQWYGAEVVQHRRPSLWGDWNRSIIEGGSHGAIRGPESRWGERFVGTATVPRSAVA